MEVSPYRFGRNTRPLLLLVTTLSLALVIIALRTNTAQALTCPNGNLISETFSSGSRWELCWEQRAKEGVVLTDLTFTTASNITRRVLKQAGLAQVHAAFDDGQLNIHQLTEAGLGGANLSDLSAADCPTGSLISDGSKDIMCRQLTERGYAYKYYSSQLQGEALQIFSVSFVSEQTYVVEWTLFDDGTIAPAIGVSGQLERIGSDARYGSELDASGNVGVGQLNNFVWRLDFDLAANGSNDIVEEIDITPATSRTRKEMTITQLSSETGRSVNPDTKRSWRVRDAVVQNSDGHAISYHLQPIHAGHNYLGLSSEPWANADVYFTQDSACEQFATQNSAAGGCGDDVTDFVDGQPIDSADIVMWYALSHHQLPRDEDEVYRNIQWNGFKLVPRDWTATSTP